MNELDLHGLTLKEAMDYFIRFYNDSLHTEFIVIHGYGSTGEGGKIKSHLRAFLNRNNDKLIFYPGEEIGRNQGTTLVKAIKPLPEMNDILSEKILEFCKNPKTKEKITGKFRSEGTDNVVKCIKKLEKNKLLVTVQKGKFKCYQAIKSF